MGGSVRDDRKEVKESDTFVHVVRLRGARPPVPSLVVDTGLRRYPLKEARYKAGEGSSKSTFQTLISPRDFS